MQMLDIKKKKPKKQQKKQLFLEFPWWNTEGARASHTILQRDQAGAVLCVFHPYK